MPNKNYIRVNNTSRIKLTWQKDMRKVGHRTQEISLIKRPIR